jgi:nucleotide-binding universal stress UspA family protein
MTTENIVNPNPRQRVVVGVDGSAQSRQALRWAAHFAKGADADVEAVAAWQYPYTSGMAAVVVAWNPREDMEKVLTQTVDDAFGPDRPANLELTVREGNAAKVLIDASHGALMLVVGSRGHGGFAGLLLGSVSANVAERATCPVLVLHGDQDAPSPPA